MPFKQDDDITRQRLAALRKGFQESGFIEGKNYSLASRFGEGDYDRVPSLAKELGALNPRVIVVMVSGTTATHAAFLKFRWFLPARQLIRSSQVGLTAMHTRAGC